MHSNHADHGLHSGHDTPIAEHTHPVRKTGRKLPRKAQVLILAVVAAVVVVGFVLGPQALHLISADKPAEQTTDATPASDGQTFKPTAQQWAGLKVVQVQQRVFQDTQDTDGKIAIDDDLATPVFSPYSGRVVKLFASAGDTVRAGRSAVRGAGQRVRRRRRTT